ncbi:MAG: hypothetical protein GY781_10465, partial [Gammaproteobacteria bacterium]|nr:hypothetical protein [Gammaproteobacteria bacterium]
MNTIHKITTSPYIFIIIFFFIDGLLNISYSSDCGDAPASYGEVSHNVAASPLVYLGFNEPDSEPSCLYSSDAQGDGQDEDAFLPLNDIDATDSSYSLTVTCEGEGSHINAWVDWNRDGSFSNDEAIDAVVSCQFATASLVWSSLSNLQAGLTYIRLRSATLASEVASPIGVASDGEVEDYTVTVVADPSTAAVPFQPTLPAEECKKQAYGWEHQYTGLPDGFGERSLVDGLYRGGWSYDTALGYPVRLNSTIPSVNTLLAVDEAVTELARNGDKTSSILGEEWLYITRMNARVSEAGSLDSITITDTGSTEQMFMALLDSAGNVLDKSPTTDGGFHAESQLDVTLNFTWPSDATVYAYTWVADQSTRMGTVEMPCRPKDYGDIPLSSTEYGVAWHSIVSGMHLGSSVSSEGISYDSTDASGDADDGVVFSNLVAGETANISASVTGSGGYLQGWIDWNDDGDFTDINEQVIINAQDNVTIMPGRTDDAGTNADIISVNVAIPSDAHTGGDIFARFRWSSELNIGIDGDAGD